MKRNRKAGLILFLISTILMSSCSSGSRADQYVKGGRSQVGSIPDFLKPVRLKNFNDPKEVVQKLGQTPNPSDVEGYAIHPDGGLIYDILSREAKKTGVLGKYDDAEVSTGTVSVGGTTLQFSLPKSAAAYDLIPIRYTVTSSDSILPVHISATAFEEESRRKGRDLYDLNIPGVVDVDIEYLGYVDGKLQTGLRPVLSPKLDNDIQGKSYPGYTTTDLIRSGTLRSSDITWLKFKYTNTGNTILDADGNGTFSFIPHLYKKEGSKWADSDITVNMHERLFDYLYPGESDEMWITFRKRNFAPGEYKIIFEGRIRNEQKDSDYAAVWKGRTLMTSSFEFTVKADAGV
ncbi:MAG TPA: hypothetical protein DD727_08295, partial [Clostridiales bacterium]|nr:hypothetical protein [Clostridiales bacterium]